MEDFKEKLASLRAELRYYEDQIYSQISAIHGHGGVAFGGDKTSSGHGRKPAVDLRNDPRNALPLLENDVHALLKEAQKSSEYFELHKDEIRECGLLIETVKTVVSITDLLSKVEAAVNSYDIVGSTELISDLRSQLALLPSSQSEIGSGPVCSYLVRESHIVIFRLNARLRKIMTHCITVDKGRILVNKVVKGILDDEETILAQPLDLSSVWMALLATDKQLCQEIAISLVKDIWTHIMLPLWKEKKGCAPRVSQRNEVSVLEIDFGSAAVGDVPAAAQLAALATNGCKMPFNQLLETLSSILSYTWSEVFCALEPLSSIMASALQSNGIALSKTLVQTLHAMIPKTEGDLHAFHRSVEKACKEFDVRLEGVDVDDAKRVKLADVVNSLQFHFNAARRREILGRARDIIVADYHNTMLASGDALDDDTSSAGLVGDPSASLEQSSHCALQILKFESCQISLASCRMVKLVHEVLKQACGGGSVSQETTTMFYEVSRDCLELFIAVIPTRFAQVIDSSPRMAAVFFNDCGYIAHNTTLLSHAYRHDLGRINDKLIGCVGYVDFIPRYRALGEVVLGKHIDAQRQQVIELVSKINIFTENTDKGSSATGSTGSSNISVRRAAGSMLVGGIQMLSSVLTSASTPSPTYPAASHPPVLSAAKLSGNEDLKSKRTYEYNDKKNAALLVKHFDWLRSQWQGVFQDVVYDRVMSHLLEAAIRAAMKPVLEADCITERAGTEISAVFRTIQEARSILSFSESLSATGRSAHEYLGSSDSVSSVTSWKKFCALTDILEYNLSEVAEWLPRKKFASFTVTEMVSLIKALFDDSPKRDGILAQIQEMAC